MEPDTIIKQALDCTVRTARRPPVGEARDIVTSSSVRKSVRRAENFWVCTTFVMGDGVPCYGALEIVGLLLLLLLLVANEVKNCHINLLGARRQCAGQSAPLRSHS